MGSSTYSSRVFDDTLGSTIRSAGASAAFAYSAAIASGATAVAVHPDLDPSKKNKAGRIIRESRDSDAHPDSVAIVILFDETGSMGEVPKAFVEKLDSTMNLITKKGYLADPHILFGAVGDAYSDEVPLQIGQFEAGNEMDSVLTKVYLEGNGGSQYKESYDLALYFMARHTEMDCLEKRGKKGYLFILGDELLYPSVKKDQVKRLIGDNLQADIPVDQILEELRDKFEVFWIFPKGSNYWDRKDINDGLKGLFGQQFLRLEDPAAVAELIATTIGIGEGFDVKSIEADLAKAGSSKKAIKSASTALATYVASTALTRRAATVEGTLVRAGKDSVKRI
jgi:hypothetical protein